MLAESQYLGSVIVCEFENDHEKTAYNAKRKKSMIWREYANTCSLLLFILYGIYVSLSVDTYLGIVAVCFFVVISQSRKLQRGYYEGLCGHTGAEIRLHKDRLMLFDRFGERKLFQYGLRAGNIESAQWLGDGCHFVVKLQYLKKYDLTLPNRFFDSPEKIKDFLQWAEHNKITIEGIVPLGFYPRSSE